MYYIFMISCMIHLQASTKKLFLCFLLVFVIFSFAFGQGKAGDSDTAKIYFTDAGPTAGRSGNFWKGLDGTIVDLRPWGGAATDATGVFYLATDGKTLFVRAEVTDASPQFQLKDTPISQAYNLTSIEVFFGTTTKRHDAYDESDSQLTIWVIKDDNGEMKVMAGRNRRLANDRQYKAAVVEWKEKSYIIEASFPLDYIGIYQALKVGQKVRCEFRINHAKPKATRSVIVNWKTPGDRAYTTPSTWSDGVVVKKN